MFLGDGSSMAFLFLHSISYNGSYMFKRPNMTEKQKDVRREQALESLEGIFTPEMAFYVRERIREFNDQFPVLESALGSLIMGRVLGWRALYLIHSPATIKKYEKHLGLQFKGKAPWNPDEDVMPERGAFAELSNAIVISDNLNEFWNIITGKNKVKRADKEKSEGGYF